MANQNPGFWISRLAGTDIVAPVTDESVIWDTANARFKFWNGTIWTPAAAGLYDVVTGNPAVNIVNSATTVNVYSTTIPGGMLGTKGIFRFNFIGSITNNAGAQTIQFEVLYASQILANTGIGQLSLANPANLQPVIGQIILAGAGATNVQRSFSRLTLGTSTNASWQPVTNDLLAHIGETVDSTVAQTFLIQVTLGNASPNLQYQHWATWVQFIAGP